MNDKYATMTVWNVELGLAIHVKTPNGKYIVIDLGSTPSFSPLEILKTKHVGYMIISHPHLDHFSDINNIHLASPDVLRLCNDYTHDELLDGVQECYKEIFQKYFEIDDKYIYPVSYDKSPKNESTFGGLVVRTFKASNCKKDNINNHSLITVLNWGTTKIVICGDNESESFEHLMQEANFKSAVKDALVLVAAHHGRQSGFHREFVELVNPFLTIISDTKKGETSNVDAYTQLSRGVTVFDSKNNSLTKRYCLTTRNDGHIKITFNNQNQMIATTNNVPEE